MTNEFRNAFSGFSRELLGNIRESVQDRLDDAAFEERIVGIENATAAMIEVDVEEDKIIQMLQKYWNLRLSEAKDFIKRQQK